MDILVATNNPAKFNSYSKIIKDLGHNVLSLKDFDVKEKPDESGKSIVENAVIKAEFFCKKTNMPTFAIDESFWVDYLAKDEQPGIKVRRCLGREVTDEELLNFYLNMVKNMPEDKRSARFNIAFALKFPDDRLFTEEFKSEDIMLMEKPGTYKKGYPLGAICLNVNIGKIPADMTEQEHELCKKPRIDAVKRIIDQIFSK